MLIEENLPIMMVISSFGHHLTALHYIDTPTQQYFGVVGSHDCPSSRFDFMTQIATKFHLLIIVDIH